jgi:hypothetical protein
MSKSQRNTALPPSQEDYFTIVVIQKEPEDFIDPHPEDFPISLK